LLNQIVAGDLSNLFRVWKTFFLRGVEFVGDVIFKGNGEGIEMENGEFKMENGRRRRKWGKRLWVEGRDAFLARELVSLKVAVCGPDQSAGNVGGHLDDAGIGERGGQIAILDDCAEHFGGAGRETERKAQQTGDPGEFHEHLRSVRNICEKVERLAENRLASAPRSGQMLGAIHSPSVPLVFPVEHRNKHSGVRDDMTGNHGFLRVP